MGEEGHGITAEVIHELTATGKLRPTKDRVLLEAIWQEHATAAGRAMTTGPDGRCLLKIGDAIAFQVMDIGDETEETQIRPGDLVINVSISGEHINGFDQSAPFQVVHKDDIVAFCPREALFAILKAKRESVMGTD